MECRKAANADGHRLLKTEVQGSANVYTVHVRLAWNSVGSELVLDMLIPELKLGGLTRHKTQDTCYELGENFRSSALPFLESRCHGSIIILPASQICDAGNE
ncbi:unnamed protein product [Schistocephalus solidus]|uniref:Uncharacterized protein n=1 Tax=Schistocephalus solidus TaxID=70667 RepID=A0A183TN18_SCHSO|nr:unnamed protein product [Schistocephalus solidus]